GGLPEAAHEAGDRGHAHDTAPAPLAHPRKHRARHLEGARHIHGEVQLPVLVAHVLELADRVDEARVVDADVDGAEVALDGGRRLGHLRRVANVTAVTAGVASLGEALLGPEVGAPATEVSP